MGHQLKIRRPRDYNPINASYDVLSKLPVSTIVVDGPNKLYVDGIPPSFTDEQVKELFQAFGQLKIFSLQKSSDGFSKRYAFAEYLDPALTHQAITGLNGMDLNGNQLTVALACPVEKHQTVLILHGLKLVWI